MIRNYFKVAWRNLMKNKTYSFINVFGLAIGLTSCMLITLYLYNELSYDNYHPNINNLYQLGTTFVKEGKEERTANTPAPMARTMQQEFPEIEHSTRLMKAFADDKTLLQYSNPSGETKSFYETKAYLADSNFFQLFNYHFIEGDAKTALANPNSLVLSKEIAQKFFGNQSAINKIIRISSSTNGDYDFKVTAVFVPSKVPSHIDARLFMSLKGGDVERYMLNATSLAFNNMYYTYMVLRNGANPKQLEAKFPAFIDKYAGKDLKSMGFYKKQFLTPVKEVHLHANTTANVTPGGSVTYLYILASIAVFTLLIACINFMNLSTARSSKRSAEVGVRKVLGAEKNRLIWQFLSESILMSLIAFLLAIGIAQLLLPLFAEVSGKQFSFSIQQHSFLLFGFLLLAIITGFVAGSYPAFYLSSFAPVRVLKGKITNSLSAVALRKTLVVFQFVISVVLIIASVVIGNQMRYLHTKDLGFVKDQQIVIPLRSGTAKTIYRSLKYQLGNMSQIESVGASLYYPGIMNPSDMGLYREGTSVNDSKLVMTNWVDDSYLQTLGIKPAAGRMFSKEFPSDTNSKMILNEQGVKDLGFGSAEKAVGKKVQFNWNGETYRWEIIGVVKDFHFKDLHVPVQPYAFQLNNNPSYNYIIAHAKSSDMSATLKSIEKAWHSVNPNEPFEYSFLDLDFYKNYDAEERLASIVGYFTIIAILISCLGLFGLAAFSAEQRIKEIGVRKVLGASVGSIVSLLSKEFLKLVGIAILIASPVAWFAMNKWLQDFAYRTNIGWQVFVVTTAIALAIAVSTVSFQAIRAAIANPVKSLRSE